MGGVFPIMPSAAVISSDRLQALRQAVLEQFEPHILERGLVYELTGRILDLSVDGGVVSAHVEGTSVYRVALDLDFFGISTCTCPYGSGFCKHLAAVAFRVLREFGADRPEEWGIFQETVARLAALRPKNDYRVPAWTAAADHVAGCAQDAGLAAWRAFYDRTFRECRRRLDSGVMAIRETFASLDKASDAWDEPWRSWFGFWTVVWAMENVESLLSDSWLGSWAFIRREWESLSEKRLVDRVRSLPAKEEPFASFCREAAVHLAEKAGTPRPGQRVAFHPGWFSLLAWLWRKVDGEGAGGWTADPDVYARTRHSAWVQALFLVMDGRDDEAWEKVRPYAIHGTVGPGVLIAETLVARREPERAAFWLERLAESIEAMDEGDWRDYLAAWRRLCGEDGDAAGTERFLQVLRSFLPRSLPHYAEALSAAGRYREWADLLMAAGFVFNLHDSSRLSVIEKKDPEALLPLFHQTVEYWIGQRNRTAYREAVRALKRLGRLYHKLGRDEEWRRFCGWLADRYGRLRAFQEELKRGKIVP
ncbi:MAG: hypothetical protein BLM47_06670 [Candidatus Reconcilbacillus cellulovorans]|mgnify:CR=1 FL=1|uniref:SWIM-type domain-containing protein n=1 Tax=Candidatus Reconcilbacillus cellulovorans TaxID=1906605 RepID=A0A2A6E0J6_9BACL|nr:MAG: hypothetical protein BLM47_06670 [Candidatus Reconcilbacillus cellulovorans]